MMSCVVCNICQRKKFDVNCFIILVKNKTLNFKFSFTHFNEVILQSFDQVLHQNRDCTNAYTYS